MRNTATSKVPSTQMPACRAQRESHRSLTWCASLTFFTALSRRTEKRRRRNHHKEESLNGGCAHERTGREWIEGDKCTNAPAYPSGSLRHASRCKPSGNGSRSSSQPKRASRCTENPAKRSGAHHEGQGANETPKEVASQFAQCCKSPRDMDAARGFAMTVGRGEQAHACGQEAKL